MFRRIGRQEGQVGQCDGWKRRNQKLSPTQMSQDVELKVFKKTSSSEQVRRNEEGHETSFEKCLSLETANGGRKNEQLCHLYMGKTVFPQNERKCCMQEDVEEKLWKVLEDRQKYIKGGKLGDQLAEYQLQSGETWSFSCGEQCDTLQDKDQGTDQQGEDCCNVAEGEQGSHYESKLCHINQQREERKHLEDGEHFGTYRNKENEGHRNDGAQRNFDREKEERNYRNARRNEECATIYEKKIQNNQRLREKNLNDNRVENRKIIKMFLINELHEDGDQPDAVKSNATRMGKRYFRSQSVDQYNQLNGIKWEMKEDEQMKRRGVKNVNFAKNETDVIVWRSNDINEDETSNGQLRNGNEERNRKKTERQEEIQQITEKISGSQCTERFVDLTKGNSVFEGESKVMLEGVESGRTEEGWQQGNKETNFREDLEKRIKELICLYENIVNLREGSEQKMDTLDVVCEKNETESERKAETENEKKVETDNEEIVGRDSEQKVKAAKVSAKEEEEKIVAELEERTVDQTALLEWGIKISNSLNSCHEVKQKFLEDYKTWCPVRKTTLEFLEDFSLKICKDEKSCNRFMAVCKMTSHAGRGAHLFATTPLAQGLFFLLAAVADIAEGLVENDKKMKGFIDKPDEIYEMVRKMEKDINLSSEIQAYLSECENQFKETGEVLKHFHDTLVKENFKKLSDDSGFREFFIELTELDSRHHSFFPQIAEAFRKLQGTKDIGSRSSKLYNTFCSSIRMDPSILDTMGMLDWSPSSRTSASSGNALQDNCEELIDEIFDDQGISRSETVKKIRRTIRVLTREKERVDRVARKLKGKSTTGQECKNSSSE